MFIVSREYGIILNFNNIVELFTGSNQTAVAAKQADGRVICLKEYDAEKEAKEAICMIAEEMSMEKRNIIYVPSSQEVKNRILINIKRESRHHNIAGKKKQKVMVVLNGV